MKRMAGESKIPGPPGEGSRVDSTDGWDVADMRRLLSEATEFHFPYRDREYEYRAYSVQWRGPNDVNPSRDQWAISNGFREVWSRDGEWVYEGSESARDEDIYVKARWPLAAAVAQARVLAQAESDRLDVLMAGVKKRMEAEAGVGGDGPAAAIDVSKVL
jgi:hypothetical protein